MNDPPGTIAPQRNPHPRRPPAHKSVSLRHSPPAYGLPSEATAFKKPQPTSISSPNPPASDKANPPSSVSPKVLSNKNSSGESSDAGKWFESTNNNAVQSNASFADNDPPFFLRNSSSSDTPPDGYGAHLYQQSSNIPYRFGLSQLGNEGSSTEEFRSVIDDLTVANKRLKQKLKKYEKLYDAHLQDEKLFEVRFHGLPDHKKRELEETLRKFASDLDHSDHPPISHQPAPFDPQKTASSTSRFAESGYASLSASGQNSTSAPSVQASNLPSTHTQDGDHRRMSKSQYNRQQQSIHTYLHDIPVGLLPKIQVPMTEKSKKKMVVRRLEQIFAGKRSAPGSHPQPMQQEEVAQSAAMADRRAKEATGQRYKTEGNREARIMPVRADDEEIAAQIVPETLQKLRPHLDINEQDFAGSGSPDQRPTRPLDLDPYRAQVPSDNMDYIRHLGFTPPDMVSEDSPEDEHGWLYLNLLINMAQLHTINVTPDFVKDAVTEYSSKFELSHDGRKIRWKGGQNMTRSSDSSSEHLSGNSPNESIYTSNGKSPSTRLKTVHSGSSDSNLDPERQARRVARAQKEKEQNKFAYTPIFFHKEESDEEDEFYGMDMGSSSNSLFQAQQAGDSSGLGSSAMRSSSSKRRRDDGPMIFYTKAKFCTDLTGDRRGLSSHNPGDYKSLSTQPIGAASVPDPTQKKKSDIGEPRGPLNASPMETESKDGGRSSSSEEDIVFFPEALRADNDTESPDAMDFEASGIGGVQPDDNFSIKVRRSHTQTVPSEVSSARRKSQHYPKKILEALAEHPSSVVKGSPPRSQRPIIKEEILSASRKSLPSSILPPASFLPFDSASSGEVDSDVESDVSSGPSTSSSSDNEPATALRLLNVSPTHTGNHSDSSDEGEESEAEESDSDDSIDFLATARKADPTTIRAFEREYDAALADRLAEEIPAGSSAATAGGGSGFNSPVSASAATSRAEDDDRPSQTERSKRQSTTSGSLSSRAQLKRARTRESLTNTLQELKKQRNK